MHIGYSGASGHLPCSPPTLWRPCYGPHNTMQCHSRSKATQCSAFIKNTHLFIHGWIYDGTERNFSKLQFRSGITPSCGSTATTRTVASWKSKYFSQNRHYLDKRTLHPSENEAMILHFVSRNSHTHTTWWEHAYQQAWRWGVSMMALFNGYFLSLITPP